MHGYVCVCSCVRTVHGKCGTVRHGLGVVVARVSGKSDLKKKGTLFTRCVSLPLCVRET